MHLQSNINNFYHNSMVFHRYIINRYALIRSILDDMSQKFGLATTDEAIIKYVIVVV